MIKLTEAEQDDIKALEKHLADLKKALPQMAEEKREKTGKLVQAFLLLAGTHTPDIGITALSIALALSRLAYMWALQMQEKQENN